MMFKYFNNLKKSSVLEMISTTSIGLFCWIACCPPGGSGSGGWSGSWSGWISAGWSGSWSWGWGSGYF